MKTKYLALAAIVSFLFIGAQAQTAQIGEIWVKIDDKNVQKELESNSKMNFTNTELVKLINDNNIQTITRAFPDSRNKELMDVYSVECNCDEQLLLGKLQRKNQIFKQPEIAPKYELLYEPNDFNEAFEGDYALDLIDAKRAWNLSKGDPNVVIAISDQNFYPNHEELVGKFNYYDAGNTASRIHGTAVAITAAGNTDNALGKSSIGFNSGLDLYRMSYNEVIKASRNGARVINVSWAASCNYSYYGQLAINEAYNNGAIIVAAAGNGSTCGGPDRLVYPAAYNHVIAVSSVGPSDNHERFIGNPASTHQHNASVDVLAPGYDVALSIAPGNYVNSTGTSFAAPLVSGLIGLLLAVKPCLDFEDVEFILKSTAVNVDELNPQYAGQLGAGRIDAFRALVMAMSYGNCNGDRPITSQNEEDVHQGNNQGGNQNGNEEGTGVVVVGNNGNNGNQTIGSEEGDFVEVQASIQIYPNPSVDRITIRTNTSLDLIQIIDERGIVVHSGKETEVVHDLKSGNYFVMIMKNNEVIGTQRLRVR